MRLLRLSSPAICSTDIPCLCILTARALSRNVLALAFPPTSSAHVGKGHLKQLRKNSQPPMLFCRSMVPIEHNRRETSSARDAFGTRG